MLKIFYLVRKPDKPGLLIITKHSVFGIQQLLHDQEKELLSHSASIHCLFPHKNHLPQNDLLLRASAECPLVK